MGTTNDWNCSFMTRDDYNNSLSNPIIIITKAEIKIKQVTKQLESTLAKLETESTNSQQLFQQLERDHIGSKKEVETLGSQNTKLKNEIQALNTKNQELYEDSLKYKSNSIEKDNKSNTISKLYDELQLDKSNLLQIIERKDKDLKDEAETITKLTEKLNEFIKEKSELKSKLISIENDQSSNEYQITRYKQEIQELRKQNEQLDENNKKQTLNFYNEVKELKSLNLELKIKNESSQETIEKISVSISQQKLKIEELDNQLYQAKEEVKKIRSEKIEANGQFENELEVQKRLVQLLKENNDEFSKKITTLQSQLDHFREGDRKMKKEHEDAYRKMEEAYEVLQEDYQKVIREYEDYKSSQINKPPSSLNDISQMVVDIPILSENVKNRIIETTNMGNREDIRKELLDMVQRYDDLTKLALNEKKEKRFLQDHLNFVLDEVEKKAPIIHEQNREYQRIKKSQEKLVESYQELQSQKDALALKVLVLTKDNSKITLEIKDLQKQICFLLKEALDNSTSVAGGVSNGISFGNTSQFNPSSSIFASSTRSTSSISQSISSSQVESDQIIPNSLITFSNIEELQIRNQELLKEIRILKNEIQNHSESDKKLEWALKELDLLKSSRERQTEMIDSLVKQKEHWRSVAQSPSHPNSIHSSSLNNNNNNMNNNNNFESMEPISINDLSKSIKPSSTIFGQSQHSQSMSSNTNNNSHMNNEYVEDLKKQFQQLQKDYEQTTKERQTSEKEMFNKMEQLKEANTGLRISLAQLESEKSISQERLKLLQDSLRSQSSELESYKKKCEEYTTTLINHQRSIENLSTNLSRAEELRSQAEIRLSNIKGEVDLLRSSESRLLEINKSITLEKISIETLLEKVSLMNSSKETSESELRKRMENELLQLEQVRQQLRKELETEKQQHKDTQMTLSHQLNESRERYEKREKELFDAKDQENKLKLIEQNLKSKISSLETQLSNYESRISSLLERQTSSSTTISPTTNTSNSTPNTSSNSNSGLDLQLARSEIESLKESLNQEKESSTYYKSIGISSESDLSKLKEEYNKYQLEMQEKISQLNKELAANQVLIQEQTVKIEKLENFTNSHQKDIDDVILAKENLVKEKQSLYDKIKQLTQEHQNALQDAKIQHDLYQRSNEKYESEVILHAEHIKELPILRNKLTETLTLITSLQSQKDNFTTEMNEAKQSWLAQENLFKSQIKELEERIKDIKHHNSLLQSQLDTISSRSKQMDTLNQMMNNNQNSSEDSIKLINELKEVIQIQSRENKILEVRNESIIQESIRLKQMLQHSQMEVENLNKQLLIDQENMRNLTVSTWKHQEVLKQLEQMNLYKESNIMLKDESKKLYKKIEELTLALEVKEKNLIPLNEENGKLHSENQVLHQEIEAQKIEIANWSNKAQKLLNKYQSIDPDEHQKLIVENDTKDKEIKNLNSTHEELKKQFEEVKKHAKHWKEEVKKMGTLKKEKADIEQQKTTLEQQSQTIKQQLEEAQKANQLEKENYEKSLTEIKKKLSLVERSKKTQVAFQAEIDQVKTELESTKKALEEKEHEITMLKSRLKLFEMKAKNVPITNTTAVTPTPVVNNTPTPVVSTPVVNTVVSSTPTTPVTPVANPTTIPTPTDLPKKRIIKKPAPSQLQNIIDTSKQTNTPPVVATPNIPASTTTITNNLPTTTTVPTITQPTTTTTTTTTVPAVTTPTPSIFSSVFKTAATIQSPLSPSSISNSPNIFSPSLASTITPSTSTTTNITSVGMAPITTEQLKEIENVEKPTTPEPMDQLMDDDKDEVDSTSSDLEDHDEEEEEDISSQHAVKRLKVDNSISVPTFENEEFETEDQTIEEVDDTTSNNSSNNNNGLVEEIEDSNNDSTMIDLDNNITSSTGSTSSQTPISTSQEFSVTSTPTIPPLPQSTQKRRLKKNPVPPVPDNLISPSQQQIKKLHAKSTNTPTLISKPSALQQTTQPTTQPTQPEQQENNILSPDQPQTPNDDSLNQQ